MSISRRKSSLWRACLATLVLAVVGGFLFNWLMPQGVGFIPPEVAKPLWKAIAPAQAKELKEQGAVFLDAREAGDYGKARLRGALKLPAGEIDKLYRFLEPTLKQAPALVVYGQSTSRFPAAYLAQHLKRQGYEKVYVLEGCLDTLRGQGFDIQEIKRQGASS
ncbi:MAG: rhodanese-like domain-containing protein [Desulfarculus sp.]|nr:rhodanese-like domain-containing protein [Desulfarculus sp.]